MNFARNETQGMVADMLARLLREQNEFSVRRERMAQTPPARLALWPAFAETGIIGALFSEEVGGFGGSGRDAAVVLYEAGRSLVVEPLLGVLVSSRALRHADSDEARAETERMIAGERIIILAHDEGFDPFAPPSVTAVSADNSYRLTGVKQVVANADVADAFLVSACLSDGTTGLFRVDADAPGVRVDRFRMMDASGGGTLSMNGAVARPLLFGDAARDALVDAVEWGVFGACAEAVGMLDALNEATREYLRTRVQFGVPIGSFQALQHRSADMFIAGEEAGVAVDAVATSMDQEASPRRSARVSALKVIVDAAGSKVGYEAVQLHGGVGVSDELIVSHYMRRLATIRATLGGAEVHRSRYYSLAA